MALQARSACRRRRWRPTAAHRVGSGAASGIPIPDGGREPPSDCNVGQFNQSHGNPNYPAYQALVDSCDFWTAVGRQRIEDHILDLSDHCKYLIAGQWGAEACTAHLDPPVP